MRIAICDDDKNEIMHTVSLLNDYIKEYNAPIKYKTFQSASELLASLVSKEYDLFLLDVMMPGMDGLTVAKEIRETNNDVKVIFLTSSPEFAVKSYLVKAHDYILKPVRKDRLYPTLNALLAERQKPREGLTLKTQSGIVRILFSKLSAVEVNRKRLYFYMSDGSVQEFTAPLSTIEETLLSRPEFVRVHRSYMVNLWQVSELSINGIITHSGKNIPVSRLLYSKVRETYMKQLFSKLNSKKEV